MHIDSSSQGLDLSKDESMRVGATSYNSKMLMGISTPVLSVYVHLSLDFLGPH